MRVIPVLDLLNGIVVRGVAGERDKYKPVESVLSATPHAQAVAIAFREILGLHEFYLADLDAILGGHVNVALYRALAEDGFELMIDAGVRNLPDARKVIDAGAAAVVAGLETSPGPESLKQLCDEFGSQRVIFSLDMKNGVPLAETDAWETNDPRLIARKAIDTGISRIIVLDLAGVGVEQGVPTVELCRRLKAESPGLSIITGGGVRNVDDLKTLRALDIDGVLVASALHNGTIGRAEIAAVS